MSRKVLIIGGAAGGASRPHVHYKASDNLALEVGSNIFFGDYPNTFFGQFRDNTNPCTAVRYIF